jgi:quinol monooxygenase YgiN
MLVVARLRSSHTTEPDLTGLVAVAVAAFATRPGHVASRLARSMDDPSLWVLVSEWENVGSYRRALSSYDVKLATGALLGAAANEPSAFEEIELPGLSAPA